MCSSRSSRVNPVSGKMRRMVSPSSRSTRTPCARRWSATQLAIVLLPEPGSPVNQSTAGRIASCFSTDRARVPGGIVFALHEGRARAPPSNIGGDFGADRVGARIESSKMPTYVKPNACDGCRALDQPVCVYVCPSDIMHIDASIGKAYNIEPDLCWECYACVKSCPQSAIAIRGYSDVVPLGASLTPLRDVDSITWVVTCRGGDTKRFKYVIRTTPWNSIEP